MRLPFARALPALAWCAFAGLASAAEAWTKLPDDREATTQALPVAVLPDNANLHYAGRFSHENPKAAECAWSASAVTVHFRGTAVNVNLEPGANRFEVAIDGVPTKILSSPAAAAANGVPTRFALAADLPTGEHTATIFKSTEAAVGDATFGGFELNAGATLLPAVLPRHKIEVVGDSISCGYGNESASKDEHFSPATENAWWTYGAIAARAFGADYECFAWSGKKMFPDNTIPAIYDLTLPSKPALKWPGEREKPDAILINLATNDFRFPQPPDHDGWVKAYREFIGRLRRESPQAEIYCALGSMMSDGFPSGRPSLSTARTWLKEIVRACNDAGDSKVRFLEFAPQQPVNGFGADYHPSVKTHEIMAQTFISALRSDLNW